MSKVTYDKLLCGPLSATRIRLLLADQTIRFPEGLAKDVLVKLREEYVPVDFVVLDMGGDEETPLILGWPFSTPQTPAFM